MAITFRISLVNKGKNYEQWYNLKHEPRRTFIVPSATLERATCRPTECSTKSFSPSPSTVAMTWISLHVEPYPKECWGCRNPLLIFPSQVTPPLVLGGDARVKDGSQRCFALNLSPARGRR